MQQQKKCRKITKSTQPTSILRPADIKSGSNGVFPFLELPGELRNRIYEYLIQTVHAFFPNTYLRPFSKTHGSHKPNTYSSSSSTTTTTTTTTTNTAAADAIIYHHIITRPIPYLSLAQTCTQIRREFRPMWLSTHCIPPFIIPSYLKTFYPVLRPRMPPPIRARMSSYFDPAGTLRVHFSRTSLRDFNLTPLLKHCARYPSFAISVVGGLDTLHNSGALRRLRFLLGNRTEKWIKWVRNGNISQGRHQARRTVWVVLKERVAEGWIMLEVVGRKEGRDWGAE